MSKDVVVIGAGGHAGVVVDTLLRMGRTVRAISDPDPAKHGKQLFDIDVVGDDQSVREYATDSVLLALGVGIGAGDLRKGLALRQTLFERFVSDGYQFDVVMSPAAIVARNVHCASGAQVMAGAVLQTGVEVGENCIINTRATIDHDCIVGAHTHVAPGAILGGGVKLGRAVHVGIGAVVAPNVEIGDGAIIAAGAVVVGNVSAHVTVYGVPAKEKNDL